MKRLKFFVRVIICITIIAPLYIVGAILHSVCALPSTLGLYLMGYTHTAKERIKDVYSVSKELGDCL